MVIVSKYLDVIVRLKDIFVIGSSKSYTIFGLFFWLEYLKTSRSSQAKLMFKQQFKDEKRSTRYEGTLARFALKSFPKTGLWSMVS